MCFCVNGYEKTLQKYKQRNCLFIVYKLDQMNILFDVSLYAGNISLFLKSAAKKVLSTTVDNTFIYRFLNISIFVDIFSDIPNISDKAHLMTKLRHGKLTLNGIKKGLMQTQHEFLIILYI